MAETNLPAINQPKTTSNQLAIRPQKPASAITQRRGRNKRLTTLRPAPRPTRTFADALNLLPSTSRVPIHILRLPEVMKRVGICRASIYQYMASGLFPQTISLGARAVGWLEHEIDAWLAVRIQGRYMPHLENQQHQLPAKRLSSREGEDSGF